jgi:hypothetical protein
MIKVTNMAHTSSERIFFLTSEYICDAIRSATWKQRQQEKTTPTAQVLQQGQPHCMTEKIVSQLTIEIDVFIFEIKRLVVVVGIVLFCVNHVPIAGDRGGLRKNDT